MFETEDKTITAELLITPPMAQASIIAMIAKAEDFDSMAVIIEGLIRQAGEPEGNLELVVQAQISMLNTLSVAFMKRALRGFDSSEVLEVLPNMPQQFADLSLRCQGEMRRCIELLHYLKNPKEKRTVLKPKKNKKKVIAIKETKDVLDTREATGTSDENTSTGTLEEINRGENATRKEACKV